jgi:rhamnose transport system substrate-binding protein
MFKPFRCGRATVLAAALLAASVAMSASAADIKSGLKIAFVP